MEEHRTSTPTHYLIVTYPSWAHVRSELGLACHFLKLNPNLHITLLIPAKRSRAAALELGQYTIDEDRVRVLHYGDDEQVEGGGMWNPHGGFRVECLSQLHDLAEPLAKLEGVVDPITSQSVIPHQIPYSLIITDITLGVFGQMVKGHIKALHPGKTPPPVLSFAPYNAAMLAFIFIHSVSPFMSRVNDTISGAGDDTAKMEELWQQLVATNADMVNIPGLWPFHLYESIPVHKDPPVIHPARLSLLAKALPTWADGLIIGWPWVFGKSLQKILNEQFKQVYQVGYSLPPLASDEWTVEQRQGECEAYLDASPPISVIYISFGSVLYPPSFDQVRVLIDVLDEVGARYVMAEGNAPAQVKEHLKSRVGKGQSKGLLVTWAPQRAVLSHPSTAVFLTHGGSNSAIEAIWAKVPMVQWPAGFDQPYIANELDKLGVAKELVQIRNGPSIGRTIARDGRLVVGTEDAWREEFKSVFGDLNSAMIRGIRQRLDEVNKEMVDDREMGESAENVKRLACFTA